MTGCSVDYTINIDKENAKEKIVAFFNNTTTNQKLIEQITNNKTLAYYDNDYNESKYYDISQSKDKKNNSLALTYQYVYPIKKLQYSNAIGECFYNKSVIKDQNYITLNTSNGVDCIYRDGQKQIDKLTVHVNTDYKVVETNADKVKDNEYIWNITDQNFKNKSIYMKIDYKSIKKSSLSNHEKIIAYIMIFLFLIFIVGLILFRMKQNKNYE